MTTKTRFRKSLLAASIGAVLMTATVTASGNGLQTQLDRLYDGMVNVTPPGVWESQRRGVLTGGRITAKAPIMNEQLIRVTPPSWKGGCGGVDMHMGSFSFINSEQMVQLLRAVAANAQGYVFQLALDSVFPQGAKWIENFQKKVQALNRAMLNSCETAQGVVNDTINAMGFSENIRGMTEASATGLVNDFFSGFSESEGRPTGRWLDEVDSAERKASRGNIVWKELRRNGVNSWFYGGDKVFLEAIMSISGTVVVYPADEEGHEPISPVPGNKLKLDSFINGGEVELYRCTGSDDDCMLEPGDVQTVTLKGLGEQISEMLLGHSTSDGIIVKLAENRGALTETEAAFMANLPGSAGSMIRNLTISNPTAAQLFVDDAANAMALHMTFNVANDMIRAAHSAAGASTHSFAPRALSVLSESGTELRHEYNMLRAEYGDLASLIAKYQTIMDNTSVARYTVRDMSRGR